LAGRAWARAGTLEGSRTLLLRRKVDEFGNSYNSHFDFLHRHFNHRCRAGTGAATKCTRTGVIEIMSVAARW
jgi:hypothetical protein